MTVYEEKRDPRDGFHGLFQCFISHDPGLTNVAHAHIHEHFELLYCLYGQYELVIREERHILRVGDIALINPFEPHRTRTMTADNNEYLVLKFSPDGLYSAEQPTFELKYLFPFLHLGGDERQRVYPSEELKESGLDGLLRRIYSECLHQSYGYEMAVRAYIAQTLLWFIRDWHKKSGGRSLDEKTFRTLRLAMDYIDAHYKEAISMAGVASHCGLGYSTFSRFFATVTGESFSAFVRKKRLAAASSLLIDTQKPVTDVGLETGFGSASYFTQCFQDHYHMTPVEYRRLYTMAATE